MQKMRFYFASIFDQPRTYAKLSQLGALPQAVLLYDKAAQQRWAFLGKANNHKRMRENYDDK
jgi:hypothetical protein